MKKKITLLLITILLLTGCGKDNNTIECIKADKQSSNALILTLGENEEVTKVEAIMDAYTGTQYQDRDYNKQKEVYKVFNEVKGMNSSVEKLGIDSLRVRINLIYNDLDIDEAKDKLEGLISDESYIVKKGINFEDFSKTYLNGYACKK